MDKADIPLDMIHDNAAAATTLHRRHAQKAYNGRPPVVAFSLRCAFCIVVPTMACDYKTAAPRHVAACKRITQMARAGRARVARLVLTGNVFGHTFV